MLRIEYKSGSSFKNLKPYFLNPSCTYKLDAYGNWSFDYPLTDPLAEFLYERNQIHFYEDDDYQTGGYIVHIEDSVVGDNIMRRVQGVSYMEEFTNEMTVPNIMYVGSSVENLFYTFTPDSIIRPTNWDTQVEDNIDETFTYLSSLQSTMQLFLKVREVTGVHFRETGDSNYYRKAEFGRFGEYKGVKIRSVPKDRIGTQSDNTLFLDESGFVVTREVSQVVNYVYPLGGGGDNGINQLTLRDVDPSIIDPAYPILIDSQTPNTETVYDPSIYQNKKTGPNTYQTFCMKDQNSIDNVTAGMPIKRALVMSDITPISSNGETITDADRVLAANQLYKAAKWFLINNSQTIKTYNFNCIGNAPDLRVGDKVNFKFKGIVKKLTENGETYVYIDVDEDFYVLGLTVTYSENGIKKYSLEISNSSIGLKNDADIIENLVSSVNDSSRQRKGSVTTYPVYFEDSFDKDYPAEFMFFVPEQTVYTDYIKMKVRVKKFRSYSRATQGGGALVTSSAAGGDHTHTVNLPNHSHGVSGFATGGEGSGSTAHQHTIQVNPTSTSAASLEALGYKYVMVQPNAVAGPHGACYVGAIGQLWSADNGGGTINGTSFKTNCTISSHTHPISAFSTNSGGGSFQTTTASGNHTHSISIPNHTHALEFGIFEDGATPTGVKIFIDGHDYSSQFGAMDAFASYPATSQETFDVMKAAANLGHLDSLLTPGAHTFEVKCSNGRAKVQLAIMNQFYISSR